MVKAFTVSSLAVLIFTNLAVANYALAAQPNPISSELIVRFRSPINDQSDAIVSADRFALGLQSSADVINGEEGLVRLTFRDEAQAHSAVRALETSGEVVSIAPNLLYRPTVKYTFHEVNSDVAPTFLGAPFATIDGSLATDRLMTDSPEVQLPPTDVKAGADPLISSDWAVKNIHLDQVMQSQPDKSVADHSMITAVIDTGVDYNHEDLRGAMWRNPSNAKEVGYDFAHNNNKPYDQVHFDIEGCLKDFGCQFGIGTEKFLVNPGHGTHCAGHVAAVAGNSTGIRGIGAGAQVMGIKFFYDFGEPKAGQGDDAAAIKAIDFAIKNGVKVMSASWGGRDKRVDGEKSELKQALIRAQKAGVLFIVAAGNDHIDQDTDAKPGYPAAYDLDNMIVVAASDSNDALATFSSYGAKSVHLAAPGVKIFSTTVGSKYSDVIATFKSGGKTQSVNWDGTSMATPIVAGAAALVWSKYPNENYHQIRDRLLKSARKVNGLQGKTLTGGVLDVAAALQ